MLGGFKYSSTLVMIAVQSGEPPARCLESLEKIWGEKGTFSSSAPSLLSLLIFVWQGRRPEGNLEDAVAACAEVSGDLRKWRVCLDTQAQCRLSSLTAQGTAGRWPTRCKYDRQGYPLHAPCIVRSCKISRSLPLSPFLPFFHLCGRQSLWPIRTWSWSSLSHTKMFRQLHYQTEKLYGTDPSGWQAKSSKTILHLLRSVSAPLVCSVPRPDLDPVICLNQCPGRPRRASQHVQTKR